MGFLLLSLGGVLFLVPISVLLLGAFFGAVIRAVESASPTDFGAAYLEDLLGFIDIRQIVLVLVIVAVLGLALVVGPLFLSARILRSSGVAKPWPVTWAGAGIAVVGSYIVLQILSIPATFLPNAFGMGETDNATAAVLGLGALAVVAVVTAVVGWLSWWWMAHLMRRPQPPEHSDGVVAGPYGFSGETYR